MTTVPLPRRRLLTLAALATLPAVYAASGSTDRRSPGGTTESAARPAAKATPAVVPTRRPVMKGGGPVPFTPGRAMLGSYVGLDDATMRQSLDLRRRQLGREQRIVHGFYDWTDDLARSMRGVDETSTLLVSWRGTHYDEINDGHWDRMIASAARRLRQRRQPLLLRWAWEMNGDWWPWTGAQNNRWPEAYIAAYRRLYRIFRKERASNVSWVWSPNWTSAPEQEWNAPARYYPGEAYVDWVGVSGYNMDKESPQQLFDGICNEFGTRKPIMITEIGAMDRDGHTKADWIDAFATWVSGRPEVGGVVWFDTDTHPGTTENFRIDSDPASLAAYRAMARSPRFTG